MYNSILQDDYIIHLESFRYVSVLILFLLLVLAWVMIPNWVNIVETTNLFVYHSIFVGPSMSTLINMWIVDCSPQDRLLCWFHVCFFSLVGFQFVSHDYIRYPLVMTNIAMV